MRGSGRRGPSDLLAGWRRLGTLLMLGLWLPGCQQGRDTSTPSAGPATQSPSATLVRAAVRATPPGLELGGACHAFAHLGNLSRQAEAAAASGATVIYAAGLGADGYSGLPAPEQLAARRAAEASYVRLAKARGIRLVLGHLCATSIVGLDTFARYWTPEFRAHFETPPEEWLVDLRAKPARELRVRVGHS